MSRDSRAPASVAMLERAERERSPYTAFLEILDFTGLPPSPALSDVRRKLGY